MSSDLMKRALAKKIETDESSFAIDYDFPDGSFLSEDPFGLRPSTGEQSEATDITMDPDNGFGVTDSVPNPLTAVVFPEHIIFSDISFTAGYTEATEKKPDVSSYRKQYREQAAEEEVGKLDMRRKKRTAGELMDTSDSVSGATSITGIRLSPDGTQELEEELQEEIRQEKNEAKQEFAKERKQAAEEEVRKLDMRRKERTAGELINTSDSVSGAPSITGIRLSPDGTQELEEIRQEKNEAKQEFAKEGKQAVSDAAEAARDTSASGYIYDEVKSTATAGTDAAKKAVKSAAKTSAWQTKVAKEMASDPEAAIKQLATSGISKLASAPVLLFRGIRIFLRAAREFYVRWMLLGVAGLLVPGILLICFISYVSGAVSDAEAQVEAEREAEEESDDDYISPATYPDLVKNYRYYNQGDYNNYMGIGKNGLQTIAQAGCGLTAIASAVATWSGDSSITPVTVLDYALNGADGKTCSTVLVSPSLCENFAKKYGVTCETVSPKDRTTFKKALSAGKSVMVLLGSDAKWSDGKAVTSSTHFIVCISYAKDGTIACMNPSGGTLCYISEDTVINDTGTSRFYIFYKEGSTILNTADSTSAGGTTGEDLANYALQFVGNPYVYGGTSLTNGTDCSGFTMLVYKEYGITLPHHAASQASYGTEVEATTDDLLPGDLIFYGTSSGTINHVAIYIGDGKVVHASNKKDGIKTSDYDYRTPIKAIRLLE